MLSDDLAYFEELVEFAQKQRYLNVVLYTHRMAALLAEFKRWQWLAQQQESAMQSQIDAPIPNLDTVADGVRDGLKPGVRYLESGDLLAAWWSDERSIAEQISPELTVHRSIRTGEVVGVKVTGVHAVIEKYKQYDSNNLQQRDQPEANPT